jgi:hypothetical protein
MFPINNGRVVVQEEWNIDIPGCPLVRSPFLGNDFGERQSRYIRQIEMTELEYRQIKPTLFMGS